MRATFDWHMAIVAKSLFLNRNFLEIMKCEGAQTEQGSTDELFSKSAHPLRYLRIEAGPDDRATLLAGITVPINASFIRNLLVSIKSIVIAHTQRTHESSQEIVSVFQRPARHHPRPAEPAIPQERNTACFGSGSLYEVQVSRKEIDSASRRLRG
jgi:hypothetical protein